MSSDDIDDLFGDDDNSQEQHQYDQPQAQADDGYEELEDDFDGAQQGTGAADAEELAEADLFGSDDGDAAPDEATGEPITVNAPLLQRPPAGKLLLLKVPNIIKVDPAPYNPHTAELEPEAYQVKSQTHHRPRDINVIRWRYRQNSDGMLSRESNARYVQWSDGTESIVLGDEVLTMERQKMPHDNTYVHAVRYDAIQGLAHIQQSLHLKPVNLNSKLHQRLKQTVQKATRKMDKVQVHLAARNPELEKAEMEKQAEEMVKLRRSQARVERTRVPKQRPPAFTAAYIEQDDDEEGDYFGAGDEDGDEDYRRRPDDDEEAAARLQSAKRSTPPPSPPRGSKQPRVAPSKDDGNEQAQHAANAREAAAAAGLKVRRGAILDDEDDD